MCLCLSVSFSISRNRRLKISLPQLSCFSNTHLHTLLRAHLLGAITLSNCSHRFICLSTAWDDIIISNMRESELIQEKADTTPSQSMGVFSTKVPVHRLKVGLVNAMKKLGADQFMMGS